MSAAEGAIGPGGCANAPPAAQSASDTIQRLPIYAGMMLIAVFTNFILGKDLAGDTLNYQFYAGFSALNDRFSQDYFAAGPPSYFNPYAYVPFYLLVKSGLTPLAIGSLFAAVHSAILWLTFELAICICPSQLRRTRIMYGICAAAIAFFNPILVQQIGSSYADITTAELILAGWLLLVRSVREPHMPGLLCGGFLLGAAAALKLTNSVHALAACTVLLFVPGAIYRRIQYALCYGMALLAGLAVVAAPWSLKLEETFGNPFFPLLNGLFRSPEFSVEPLRHFRFVPESFTQALWRPFAIANPVPMVQEEMTAPDLRYSLLILLLCAFLANWLRLRIKKGQADPERIINFQSRRALVALGCGLLVDWILWLTSSGNGRYFLPMASVAAAVIVGLIFFLFGTWPKLRNYILAIVLGAQMIQLYFGANLRWNSVPWDQQWLSVDMPAKLSTEPNLYMTVGIQSNSFIAAFLARGSGLINFSGGYALGAEGATGARIDAMIRRYAPRLRVLWHISELQAQEANEPPNTKAVDDPLSRFGLKVDTSDCVTITLHGLPPEPEIIFLTEGSTAPEQSSDTSYLASCHLVPDQTDHSADSARHHEVDIVLDRVEDACPALFQPRRLYTENYRDAWRRLYVNTDLVVLVSRGTVKFLNPPRGGQMIILGSENDWKSASPPRLECGRRGGLYFANEIKSGR